MGHVAIFPAAEVFFQNQEGEWAAALLLIDSGATISALPKSDAQVFGITAEQGERMDIRGIGPKPIVGWRHELPLKLQDNQLVLPVVFLDTPQAPRVLGREGIFDHFTVVFEESRRRTGLIAEHTHAEQDIRKILDQV
jgi:hypothetical protein